MKPNDGQSRPERPRAERARAAIGEAALTIFLRDGFEGASVDEIVALASVSKATVYKRFTDKRGLFAASILEAIDSTYEVYAPALEALTGSSNVERDLRRYARVLLEAVMTPMVLQMRRLMIAEANHFPDLGQIYYARTYERSTAALASTFKALAGRGLLEIGDPRLAAHHFTWLLFGEPRNKVMLCGDGVHFTPAQLRRFADTATRAFLAIYAPEPRNR